MPDPATLNDSLSSRAGTLVTGHWVLPGITTYGLSSISLTNPTAKALAVKFDDVQTHLPAGGLLTLPLDPYRQQTVEIEGPAGAQGSYMLHDKTFNWAVAGTQSPFPFRGPLDVAVISDPSSSRPVQIEAQGQLLGTVEPGQAWLVRLDAVQALDLVLSSSGDARGVFGTLAQD